MKHVASQTHQVAADAAIHSRYFLSLPDFNLYKYAAVANRQFVYLRTEDCYPGEPVVAAEEAKCVGHLRIAQCLYSII